MRVRHSIIAATAATLRGACLLALLLWTSGCEEGAGVDPRERQAMQAIFDEARRLDEAGRYHEALVRYETILARHPNYASTRLNAAMAAYDSGQYEKAAAHFEVLRKAGPRDWFVIRKLISVTSGSATRIKSPCTAGNWSNCASLKPGAWS